MADNTPQTGSATIRAKDRAGVETQIFGIDVGIGTATEVLMSPTNPLPTSLPTSNTGNLSTTTLVAGTSAIIAAAGARYYAAVYNDGTADVKIGLAALTTSTSFTVLLGPGDFYEVPAAYTGNVSAWSAGTPALRVTTVT